MEPDINPEKLRRIKSLARFNNDEIAEFLKFVEFISCPAGKTLLHEGQPGDTMYLIVEGKMRVFSIKPDGEVITRKILDSGDAFGDVAFFNKGLRVASVEAVDDSRLIQINEGTLKGINTKLASKFLFALANSLTATYAHFR